MTKATHILIAACSICFVFICSLYKIQAQDTLTYGIKAGTIHLGEVTATHFKFKNGDSVRYRLESKLKVFSFYKIHYLMETVYEDSTLKRSLSSITVNSEKNHYCVTKKTSYGYLSYDLDGDTLRHYKPIKSSVTPYYFNYYSGPDTIFSEYSGHYRVFIPKTDSSFILHPEDPMEFYFNNNHIYKVIIPNPILDFHIELQKNNSQ